MTRRNPDGTYRLPIENAGTFRIESNEHSCAIFGDLVNKLGLYESHLTIEEAVAFKTKK